MDWMEPLIRGTAALAATGLLFAVARARFRTKEEGADGPADVGLD